MNSVSLIGRLTRDPELKKTSSDIPFTLFTLAVDNFSKSSTTANFIPIIVWRDQAINICKFLHKGSLIGVNGYIAQRSYDKLDGTKAYLIEVVANNVQFLESKNKIDNNMGNKNADEVKNVENIVEEEIDNNVQLDNNIDNDIDDEILKDEDLPF